MFRVPTVATLLARAQLRWLGHLARAGEGRIAQRLPGAVREEKGRKGKGNRGVSLMCVSGQKGILLGVLEAHLTKEAVRRPFLRRSARAMV